MATAVGVYGIVSSIGNLGAGISLVVGAATGDLQGAEQAAQASAVGVSPTAIVTLVVTNGNLNAASTAASAEGIFTAGFGPGATGEAPTAVDLIDTGQNAVDLVKGHDNDGNENGNNGGNANSDRCRRRQDPSTPCQ